MSWLNSTVDLYSLIYEKHGAVATSKFNKFNKLFCKTLSQIFPTVLSYRRNFVTHNFLSEPFLKLIRKIDPGKNHPVSERNRERTIGYLKKLYLKINQGIFGLSRNNSIKSILVSGRERGKKFNWDEWFLNTLCCQLFFGASIHSSQLNFYDENWCVGT